jgi:hypothetical protein
MAIAPFAMGPAKQPDSGTNNPGTTNGLANTASAIFKGSILGLTSNLLNALATTPTAATIVGVAASPNQWTPGYNMGNQPTTVDFRANNLPYYRATTDTIYASHMTNGSDTYVTPATTDIGVSYGIRVRADGEVTVDRALVTTDARVKVLRINIEFGQQIVEWTFLATAILP